MPALRRIDSANSVCERSSSTIMMRYGFERSVSISSPMRAITSSGLRRQRDERIAAGAHGAQALRAARIVGSATNQMRSLTSARARLTSAPISSSALFERGVDDDEMRRQRNEELLQLVGAVERVEVVALLGEVAVDLGGRRLAAAQVIGHLARRRALRDGTAVGVDSIAAGGATATGAGAIGRARRRGGRLGRRLRRSAHAR